jgi:hypothetical protein
MSHEDYQLERLVLFIEHLTLRILNISKKALKHIYTNRGGLQQIFIEHQTDILLQTSHTLNEAFFEIPHLSRTRKNVEVPNKGSVARELICV